MSSSTLPGSKHEPPLIQRERAIVQRFRQATRMRKQAEDDAAARLRDVDDRHTEAKRTIDEWLSRVQDPVSTARTALNGVGEGFRLPGGGSRALPAGGTPTLSDVQKALTTATRRSGDVSRLCNDLRIVRGEKERSQPGAVVAAGVLNIILGIVFLIVLFSAMGSQDSSFAAGAPVWLIAAVISFGIAFGLFARQGWARVLVMIGCVLYGVFFCYTIVVPIICYNLYQALKRSDVASYFNNVHDDSSITSQLASAASDLANAEGTALKWHTAELAKAESAYQNERSTTQQQNQQTLALQASDYGTTLRTLRGDIHSLDVTAGKDAASWASDDWRDWEPPTKDTGTPPLVRLGAFSQVSGLANPAHEMLLAPAAGVADFPVFAPIIAGQRPLLFSATGAAKAQAVDAIQSMLLRLLLIIPPGKLRFTFIDPIGLGQNVAPFMYLKDHDEQLITSKAWTDPAHIEQRLADLTEHMENVIQNYLRNEYATIEEYNKKAGEVAEPYRVLVVFDFPNGFSETAARRLVTIANHGPRCGVFVVALHDTAQPLPYGFNINDLTQPATQLTWTNNRYAWRYTTSDSEFEDCTVQLDRLPDQRGISHILQKNVDRLEKKPQTMADCSIEHIMEIIGKTAAENSKVEVPFARIAPDRAQWWQADSREGLRVALGPFGARKFQYLELGKGTAHHVLVAGRVGSGKSTLLHTIIDNLALTYGPEELELYLIDFKKGVEFKPYAANRLPHARVIAIESEREYGLSVLDELDKKMTDRGALFRAAGTDEIAKYRNVSGTEMPRILLLVDEFQEFFTVDDQTSNRAAQILDRLVRQGRAFGLHVLLGSQTLAGAYTLARSTMDQMGVRIALQCTDADSRLILADDNPAARLLSRPGDAIYNDHNGLVEGNARFQVAVLKDSDEQDYLNQLHTMAAGHHYPPPIVFEGNALGEITDNADLLGIITASNWPIPAPVERAWLGEPIAIAPHVSANFRRQSGSNLLIVGQNEEAGLGMLATSLISLAAQHHPDQSAPNHARFMVIDYSAVDGQYANYMNDNIITLLPHDQNTITVVPRRRLEEALTNLVAEIQQRLAREAAIADGVTSSQERPDSIYLVIYGLQRARDIRPDEMGMPSFDLSGTPQPPSAAQLFSTALRDGPEVGVHTLAWCDTVTNLHRSLERRSLREFSMRAAFQMSAEDSSALLDTPAASRLGQYRALYISEDEGLTTTFRPYGLPSSDWVKWCAGKLRAKAGVRQQVTPPTP